MEVGLDRSSRDCGGNGVKKYGMLRKLTQPRTELFADGWIHKFGQCIFDRMYIKSFFLLGKTRYLCIDFFPDLRTNIFSLCW